jgi:hypothetical protein
MSCAFDVNFTQNICFTSLYYVVQYSNTTKTTFSEIHLRGWSYCTYCSDLIQFNFYTLDFKVASFEVVACVFTAYKYVSNG